MKIEGIKGDKQKKMIGMEWEGREMEESDDKEGMKRTEKEKKMTMREWNGRETEENYEEGELKRL